MRKVVSVDDSTLTLKVLTSDSVITAAQNGDVNAFVDALIAEGYLGEETVKALAKTDRYNLAEPLTTTVYADVYAVVEIAGLVFLTVLVVADIGMIATSKIARNNDAVRSAIVATILGGDDFGKRVCAYVWANMKPKMVKATCQLGGAPVVNPA